MDPRIREHADIIIEHSVDATEGDNVVIDAAPAADDLLTALYERLADIGANPLAIRERMGKRFRRAYLRNSAGEFEVPDHERALFEAMDIHIAIQSDPNATELSDVDGETQQAYQKARKPLTEERLSKTWCLTQYPSDSFAQLAQQSTEGYENFVWDAVNKDWEKVRAYQQQLVEILDPAEQVQIVSGDATDVTMSIAGNRSLNDYGERNLPGGEVFTAPVRDSVEGEVLFDKPVYVNGSEVTGARLVFQDGRVIEHSAEKNEGTLTDILETDEGARYLGELGIGMNRDINEFTYNMLFDEKIGDTVHMAVGRAYEATVGPDNEANDSAQHVDMIVDMSEDSFIEVDGKRIQEDGEFIFE